MFEKTLNYHSFYFRHQHSPLTRCVPPPRLKDSPSHVTRAPSHSQVSTVYLHHEHCQYPRHSHHYKLELPRSSHPLDAKLDPGRVHQVSANLPVHAETQEDPVTVDDGDAGRPAIFASHASSSAPESADAGSRFRLRQKVLLSKLTVMIATRCIDQFFNECIFQFVF